jgi:hypothetical protein
MVRLVFMYVREPLVMCIKIHVTCSLKLGSIATYLVSNDLAYLGLQIYLIYAHCQFTIYGTMTTATGW